ncbi:RNA-binding protein [Thermogladius sp. KZ2Tp1]|uniref:H/ACA ribonucleoprotein complex subunit GAR1 n=1 Tax=Thermogladius sp. KZ2Tp1 TaxID=3136289 RepID=UPI003DA86853
MRRLGFVEVVGKNGILVVRPSVNVREDLIGSLVYDSNLRRLGKVVDIVGRVDDPRVIVKLESRDLASTIRDYNVYYEPAQRRGARKQGGETQ